MHVNSSATWWPLGVCLSVVVLARPHCPTNIVMRRSMGVRTGCQVHRYEGTVQYQTATATLTAAPPPLAVCVAVAVAGWGMLPPWDRRPRKPGFPTLKVLIGQKFQELGLNLKSSILTFRDLSRHLCHEMWGF